MLGPGRYLLGAAEIAVLAGCAWLGAAQARRRLTPELVGVVGGLATAVLALALALWCAVILGTFSAFAPVPFLALVAVAGLGIWWWLRSPGGADPRPRQRVGVRLSPGGEADGEGAGATLVALLVAALAVIHFALGVKAKLSTGMTGFDSTWYHGPFAAGFFQSGDTWGLHEIAPQFLAWFYPENGEVAHAVGMLAFSRDLLSPLLNLGWFLGCLAACWCVGRPHRVGAWSLALGAVALSVPALHDQAGEARNDIVAIFFLLAAVAFAVNAWGGRGGERHAGGEQEAGAEAAGAVGSQTGAVALVGLAAGLAAGTKLNFLLPAGVLVAGVALASPAGRRWRALWIGVLAAFAGGGYWYVRNLAHSGNPLPWVRHLGPIDLPGPAQALGGREAHSVLSYLTDGSVWSDWFLPGLHHGLWIVWPLLGLAALSGLLLPSVSRSPRDRVLIVAGLVGLASALAWLVAPTSASGPDGVPRGFESGLRYLAPALVLGLTLLPSAPQLRPRLAPLSNRLSFVTLWVTNDRGGIAGGERIARLVRFRRGMAAGGALALLVVAVGYPVQRRYLEDRYASPSFTTPGLNSAFKWARSVSGARIATTSTRQYPLFGTDLSNRVRYVGIERPHGGFEAPASCRQWRRLLDEGGYDYVVASRDRIEPGAPPYPPAALWTEGPGARLVLAVAPTKVFKLTGPLDPSAC